MQSKEKEDNGACCQTKEEQDRAEALTYEQSFVVQTHSIKSVTKEPNE